jgi:F0F1-type ATP synthase assembly protein I
MSRRRYTRTVGEHDRFDSGSSFVVLGANAPESGPTRIRILDEQPRRGWRALRDRAAVAALLVVTLVSGALVGVGLRWLWAHYRDAVITVGEILGFVLLFALAIRGFEIVSVHWRRGGPDEVSPETLERLRREDDR